MPGMVRQRKQKSSWIAYIHQRIRQNKNFIGFVSGPTGSGKSYSCLRIGEEVDSDFDIDRVVFGGKELMQLINSGTLKKGSCIVWEELGVGMSNRNWQSITNKALNYLVMTFRHRNFVLLLNAPYMDFADASLRKLFHAELRTISIDFKEKKVRLKPQLIQYNPRMQKFYYKYLRVITSDGVVPIIKWGVAKPSKKLLKAYETKKKQFTNRLNVDILTELESVDAKKAEEKELTDVQKGILGMIEKEMTVEDIIKSCGTSKQAVYMNLRFIKKKGYKLSPVWHEGRIIRYTVAK